MLEAGERVGYSMPDQATEYTAICLPAFFPETVDRDSERARHSGYLHGLKAAGISWYENAGSLVSRGRRESGLVHSALR